MWSKQNFNWAAFISSIRLGLYIDLTKRNSLDFNIQSIELGEILCSNVNHLAGFSMSFCVALLREFKIVCLNSGIITKDWPDQDTSITYSNSIYKPRLGSYPCFLAYFINRKIDSCEIHKIVAAIIWVIINFASYIVRIKTWTC